MEVLFKDKEVQQLLDDFQSIAKVRIAVFDTEFNELYSCPREISSFCDAIRKYPIINEACRHCDQKAFLQSKAQRDTYIYQCHLGLYEAVTPIYNSEQILGYVMIGQMLNHQPMDLQWKSLLAKYPRLKNHLKDHVSKFNELEQLKMSEIKALVNIMQACASSIWLKHILNITQLPLIDKIAHYVENNYSNTIDTDTICHDLNTSKTTIYNCLKAEYHLSLSQYITKVRIDHSKELLENSNLSIADIAMAVGFNDYNYYIKKFKELTLITPSRYQKKHKK